MLNTLGPRHVRDVNQSVYSGLDLNECTKRGQVPDLTGDARTEGEFQRENQPRVLLGLLHSQRDLLVGRIDLEHDSLNRLAN